MSSNFSIKNTTVASSTFVINKNLPHKWGSSYVLRKHTRILLSFILEKQTLLSLLVFCHKTHVVGTVNVNRKGFPKDVTKAKLKKGGMVSKEDPDTGCRRKSKKEQLLSSMQRSKASTPWQGKTSRQAQNASNKTDKTCYACPKYAAICFSCYISLHTSIAK